MAHWAYLRSCKSPQEAVTDTVPGGGEGTVELESRYAIPLFWLAAFDETNILRARSTNATTEAVPSEDFVVLCASGAEAVSRLRARAAGIVQLLPAVYAPFFEEWIRFVKASFPHYLVLRAEDLFSMGDSRDAELRVTAAVRSLSRAEEGKPVKELDALDYFGNFRDLFATRPASEEPAITAMRVRTQLAGFNRIEPTALDGWPRSPTAAELASIGGIKMAEPPPQSPAQAQLAITIQQGVSANSLREGFSMAAGKLSGRIPLGADAPTKFLRKTIGGSGEFFELLRSGFFGILGLVLGPLFLWVGFSGSVVQWPIVAFGFGCLVLAGFLLRSAFRAYRNLRTIMRA